MSRRVPGSSQDTFRDSPSDSPPRRPRVTELPEELHNKIIPPPREWEQRASERVPSRPSHPSSQNASNQQQLPFISTRLPSLRGGIDQNRGPLPSLREATAFVPEVRSSSASPASLEYDDRQRYDVAHQQHQEPFSNPRGSVTVAPHSSNVEAPRHPYQLAPPVQGTGVSHIARPSSAHDSAYLSDLSTFSASSSIRGGPPPSHASTESTASASSELSRTRVRSWQRAQYRGVGEGHSMAERRDERGANDETGRLTPTYPEIEYERRHGGRAHFPVSTMRGGSVSSRGHSYGHGASSLYIPASHTQTWEEDVERDAPSWSGSEHEAEAEYPAPSAQRRERTVGGVVRRQFSGSEPASSVTSPIPSERSASTRSHGDDPSIGPSVRSVVPRRTYEAQYASWTTHARVAPEPAEDLRGLTAPSGLTVRYASGSPPGSKEIHRTTERFHLTHPPPNPSRGALEPGANFDMPNRQSGSSSYSSGRVRGRDELASPQGSPYTSLPRYSAGPSNAPHPRYAGPEEARYARELPLPQHEGRYDANPALSAPLPQRSYTFPATSEERAYPQQIHRPPADVPRAPFRGEFREPVSGTPPPYRQHLVRTPPAFQGLSQTYGSPPIAFAARASTVEQGDDMIVSPGPTPVPSSIQERKEAGGFLRPEYAYPDEEPHFSRHTHQLSQPFPASSDSPPKAKRSRSASIERSSRLSMPMGGNPHSSIDPTFGADRGGASRGRGHNLGKRTTVISQMSESTSREEPQFPIDPPGFWGRRQGTAQGPSSSSPTMIAPAPRRTGEPPIHPDLLRMSHSMRGEEPIAGSSSGQSRSAHSSPRKGKGRVDDAGDAETQESADREEDELQETSDEEDKPRFNVGSSGPSRTGSAGGTRAPRHKIEVACDFCRKRKMKCDGLRPSCKNCLRKGVACSYIPVVRRRGPGKKKKAIDSRPKKTNKRIEGERQVKGKGKDRATESTDVSTQETETGEASGSGLQVEGTPSQQFSPAFSQPGPSSELYLPSPLQHMQSPQVGERSSSSLPSGPNISPFSSGSLSLPLYPPERFPSPYGQSPPFRGGNLFLPGQSPTMGDAREIVDPYAGVGVNIPESGGSSTVMSDVGAHSGRSRVPLPGTARTASMFSSGPSSSEGELGRQSRRRRTSKRTRTDEEVRRTEHELEEGEIDEGGPSGSSGLRR